MTELKACKVCDVGRQNCYGIAVTSLGQLKIKGAEALGISASASVSVVLEDDGTIIEDEDYFLCLPANTKFMLLDYKETWTPALQGTGHPNRDYDHVEVDGQDDVDGAESWHSVAERLRQNLANIILMSEADLQSLIDVPCSELAAVLGFSQQKTRVLQDTLQTVVDRREEERQSKEILQLYLKATEQEGSRDPQDERAKLDETDGVQLEATAGFSSKTLMVLKDKTHPETRLSNEELQLVVKHGLEVMEKVLGWDSEKTAVLVQACEAEISKRLRQVQALQSLHSQSRSTNISLKPQNERETRAKRSKKTV
ncbi:DNA fragmentation factor subunit alpha [Misgurnus anguillicaudatus]|uniref:DNA fragmentation factor subunit alpha n=1 Tax=Misgurnus anguillicaudatus TaxID=75329 RepID=UPI003CCF1222